MNEKYKNKYRIKSARLPNWDYGSNGMYFITICTQNRVHFFGKIINKKMQLNEIGEMAEKYWNEIPQHFPFVKLDAFVVMPNHIHGILIIDKMDDGVVSSVGRDVAMQRLYHKRIHQYQKSKNGKYFPKIWFHFHHYTILQIGHNQKRTINKYQFRLAIPFSRPYNTK